MNAKIIKKVRRKAEETIPNMKEVGYNVEGRKIILSPGQRKAIQETKRELKRIKQGKHYGK